MSEYEADILLWSEHQAGLLRRLARGEAVNEPPDWDNIIEEVESVGSEQLHAVESLLLQALVHMLKAEAWPLSREASHWQAEARLIAPRRACGSRPPCGNGSISSGSMLRPCGRCRNAVLDDQPPLPSRARPGDASQFEEMRPSSRLARSQRGWTVRTAARFGAPPPASRRGWPDHPHRTMGRPPDAHRSRATQPSPPGLCRRIRVEGDGRSARRRG